MKILVINGPNLNMLGKRDNNIYGTLTIKDINSKLSDSFPEFKFTFFQSNHEGEIIDQVQKASDNFDGLIINPAAYSHTSIAIRDALEICSIPKIEVHLSNISAREDFRKTTLTSCKCDGYITGFKELSYLSAAFILKKLLK